MMNLRELEVIVIGNNNCWGKGDTMEEALKNASRPRYYYAYVVYPGSYVDEMGGIVRTAGDFAQPKLIQRKVDRRTKALLKKIEAPMEVAK